MRTAPALFAPLTLLVARGGDTTQPSASLASVLATSADFDTNARVYAR